MIPKSDYRILVVDDETIMRDFLTDILSDQGYQTVKVQGGEQALRELERDAFHLVITDLKMPGLDGVHLFRHIRREMPKTRVILMTGYSMSNSGKPYLTEGAFGFILKPFDLDQIRSLVHDAWQAT